MDKKLAIKNKQEYEEVFAICKKYNIQNDLRGFDLDNGVWHYMNWFEDTKQIVTGITSSPTVDLGEFISTITSGNEIPVAKVEGKTFGQVINEIVPEIYRSLAYYNCIRNGKIDAIYHGSEKAIVDYAFIWDNTPEGIKFWSLVNRFIRFNEGELPPIPKYNEIKTLKGIVPEYSIVLNRNEQLVSVGCQKIPVEKMWEFVDEFVKMFPKKD